MLKIFNFQALTKKQRMVKALVFGVLVAAGTILVNYLFIHITHRHFTLLYVLYGFLIGYAIQYFGRGVQIQFSILGAVLALIVIIVCDLMIYPSVSSLLGMITEIGVDSLLELAYRLAGIYLAYHYARIL